MTSDQRQHDHVDDDDDGDGNGHRRGWLPVRTVDPLARSLGVASLGLGAGLLAAPGSVIRLAGLRDTPGARVVAGAVGVRELVAGVGILASRRPVGWLWARATADGLDVTLLTLGAAVQSRSQHRIRLPRPGPRRSGPGRAARDVVDGVRSLVAGGTPLARPPRRTVAAIGVLTGVAVVDLVAAVRLTRRRGPHRTASVSITVDQPQPEVYRRWRELQAFPRFMSHLDLRPVSATPRPGTPPPATTDAAPGGSGWDADVVHEVPGELIEWRSGIASHVDHAGTVRFEPGPGGSGTRVTVRVDYRPPGGLVGSLVAGFLGEHPRQQISDDLLRFKHILESDGD